MTVSMLVLVAAFLAPMARHPFRSGRCAVPLASDRISDTQRKHALRKQEEQAAEAERASRAARAQQLGVLRASRIALEACEGVEPRRACRLVLNELHALRKQHIDPDVPCLESAARTLAGAGRWQETAAAARELRSSGMQVSEARAAEAMLEALARTGDLTASLCLMSDADRANLSLASSGVEPVLSAAASAEQWADVLALYRRLCSPSGPPEPASTHPPTLLAVIKAHGRLGDWRQAVRLGLRAARAPGAPADALLAATAEACADNEVGSAHAARTARRLYAKRPSPEAAHAAIRALATAGLMEDARRVTLAHVTADSAAREAPLFADEPRAWSAAVAAAEATGDTSLTRLLGRCRSEGGSRGAHLAVLRACAPARDAWELAAAHLAAVRPLRAPHDEREWLVALEAAAKAGESRLVIEMIDEIGELDSVSDEVLPRALPLGLEAAQGSEGVRMLARAASRAPWHLWVRAFDTALEAGEPRAVFDALAAGGPASSHASAGEGQKVLATAASALIEGLLAPWVVDYARQRTFCGALAVSHAVNEMSLGMRAAEMTKKSVASEQRGGPALPLPSVDLLGRVSCVKLGFYVSGLSDAHAIPDVLGVSDRPRRRKSALILDMLSLLGVGRSPEVRQQVRSIVRQSSGLNKGVKAAAQASNEAERVTLVRDATQAYDVQVEEHVHHGKQSMTALAETQRLLEKCSDSTWDLFSEDASLMLELLARPGLEEDDEDEDMEETLATLAGMDPDRMTSPGCIVGLATLLQCAGSPNFDKKFVPALIAASEVLSTFLERHRDVGTADERNLAYAMLAQLLHQTQLLQVLAPMDDEVLRAAAAFNTESPDHIDTAKPLLTVLRMVAEETSPPTPRLLSQLLLGRALTAEGVNATLHAFVEAGGQPTGEQLVHACLGAIPFTFEYSRAGVRLSTSWNASNVRASWFELKDLWRLALRVSDGLWPELRAAGESAKSILEPIQDIVLYGTLAQLQFGCMEGTTLWDFDELKCEVRAGLREMSIPSAKVEVLLHGDKLEVLGRTGDLLTCSHVAWEREDGWSVERRMFAPLLTRTMRLLDDDPSATAVVGKRLVDGGLHWEYEGAMPWLTQRSHSPPHTALYAAESIVLCVPLGTIAPRLHRGLNDPLGADSADREWSMRVIRQIAKSPPMMELLERALGSLKRGEAFAVAGKEEEALAQKAHELLGLDVRELASWSADEQADLATGLSLMKGILASAAFESHRGGKRTARVAPRSGFGGGGTLPKVAKGAAGRARKNKGSRKPKR